MRRTTFSCFQTISTARNVELLTLVVSFAKHIRHQDQKRDYEQRDLGSRAHADFKAKVHFVLQGHGNRAELRLFWGSEVSFIRAAS